MILNSAPQEQAILSNVGEIGEFRIRNSAKAFNILSSGLYANKIRAIIRELSCNAVDSHVAAGKSSTPFDVHLPNQLEPWFAIRDYGTGLTHEQVTNIYTTYFESTKTTSNEFIGALGLGSKSPFSYTDNFTVTAVRDGVKGIYTAFINAEGVPSIALMMSEDTTDPAGVEVKFSVNDRWDFSKFQDEARQVYTYFKLRPVISGKSDFQFNDIEYESKDIVPGIHSSKNGNRSVAIMGNIAYPIEVPQANHKDLGDVAGLLNCGLEIHFAIGELDFQASREGLSYIPQTVESIKNKLETLNSVLATVLAKEADTITNLWDRAIFLSNKSQTKLWAAAVKKYAVDTKLSTYDVDRYNGTKKFKIGIDELAKKYNISVRGFDYSKHTKAYTNLKSTTDYSDTRSPVTGAYTTFQHWGFTVSNDMRFIVNDTNIGAVERAKFHYRSERPCDRAQVYVLDRADKTNDMKLKEFFKAIGNPPESYIGKASALTKKVRADSGLGKNVTILCLQERGSGGYYRQREMVWRDAGKADSFDANTTYYYLPLSGFEVQSKYGMNDVKEFYNDLYQCGVASLKTTIYGVRKSDIEYIKTQTNWINIEDHIAANLKTVDTKLMLSLAIQAIDSYNLMQYNKQIVNAVTSPNSPYAVFVKQLEGHDKIRYSESSLKRLSKRYAPDVNFSPEAFVQKFVDQCATVSKQYPLLAYLRSAPNTEVADYINLVDQAKGI